MYWVRNIGIREHEPEQYLKRKAFFSAKHGLALTLHCALIKLRSCDSNRDVVKECVDEIHEDDGQRCTLLITAARRGHLEVVKTLLALCKPDVEKEGSVKFDGSIIDGASALWCAAGAGHLNVVKALAEANADVNHATITDSTPLRAACFHGHLDIVQYLVRNSADIHLANKYNNTCLMIASHKGHLEVVKYLLSVGVDPDACAQCGATALHFAAACGEQEVVRALVEEGRANIRAKNNIGMTPLIVAAEATQASVVEYLITCKQITQEERIEAMELLGASYCNDKDSYCPQLGLHYLRSAMKLRFPSNGEQQIPKPVSQPIPAYENHIECQNMSQLTAIEHDFNALHMESLCVRERILGPSNPEVTTHVIFRGAVFADFSRFDRSIQLWMHALQLRQNSNISIVKDLLRFAQIFSQMLHLGILPSLQYIEDVLQIAIAELEKSKREMLLPKDDLEQTMEDLDSNLSSILYILVIATKLLKKLSRKDFLFHHLVFQLNQVGVKMRDGQTLLHMAVNAQMPVDDFYTNDICRFPCADTADLLIKCGADVNAMDSHRNTPLHIIVRSISLSSDFLAFDCIVQSLVNAGAHTDIVNHYGRTPLEEAATIGTKTILRAHMGLSLKCLAAKAVNVRSLKNQDVPESLLLFIDLHNANQKTED